MGMIAVVAMTAITTLNVILRKFFNKPLLFYDEYVGYLFLIAVVMGFAYCARKGTMIKVDLVISRLSNRKRDVLEVITSVVTLGVLLTLLWYYWDFFAQAVIRGDKAETVMRTPLWIPRLFMALGAIFLCLEVTAQVVKKTVAVAKRAKREEGPDLTTKTNL